MLGPFQRKNKLLQPIDISVILDYIIVWYLPLYYERNYTYE